MLFRPSQSLLRYGLGLLVVLAIALAGWLWTLLAGRMAGVEFDGGVFLLGLAFALSLVLAGMLAYMTWCAASMRYRLDDTRLSISVAGVRHIVPLESVTAVYLPGTGPDDKPVEVLWKRTTPPLPGYVVGAGISMKLGNVLSVSTLPVPRQVFVATPGYAFGISPRDPDSFVTQLRSRLKEKPPRTELYDETEEAELELLKARPRTDLRGLSAWGAPIWGNALARGLFLGGLALCALLFGYLGAVYESLPPNLAIHWDANAQPDVIGGPIELLRLPAFALAIWVGNVVVARMVQSRERAAMLFLLAGGLAVQIVFAAATLSIVVKAV